LGEEFSSKERLVDCVKLFFKLRGLLGKTLSSTKQFYERYLIKSDELLKEANRNVLQ